MEYEHVEDAGAGADCVDHKFGLLARFSFAQTVALRMNHTGV